MLRISPLMRQPGVLGGGAQQGMGGLTGLGGGDAEGAVHTHTEDDGHTHVGEEEEEEEDEGNTSAVAISSPPNTMVSSTVCNYERPQWGWFGLSGPTIHRLLVGFTLGLGVYLLVQLRNDLRRLEGEISRLSRMDDFKMLMGRSA